MHFRVLAPLLSAAFSTVCIWIISATSSASSDARRPLDHGHERPGLAAGNGPALRNRHGVALTRLAGLVMGQQAGGATDVLAIARMLEHARNLHRNGLRGLRTDDRTGQRALRLFGCFGHAHLPPVLPR